MTVISLVLSKGAIGHTLLLAVESIAFVTREARAGTLAGLTGMRTMPTDETTISGKRCFGTLVQTSADVEEMVLRTRETEVWATSSDTA